MAKQNKTNTLNNTRIEGNIPKLLKSIHKKNLDLTSYLLTIMHNDLFSRIRNRVRMSSHAIPIQYQTGRPNQYDKERTRNTE